MSDDRRFETLRRIRNFIASNGYAPTIAELAKEMQLTKPGVQHHLITLKADGYVTWEAHKGRTLRILKMGG